MIFTILYIFCFFKEDFKIEATTAKNGQNLKVLRELSKLTNINICFGYTFKEDNLNNYSSSNIDFDKVHSDLRYELTYGFEEFIPTFLGEFFLTKNFPSEIEKKYFDILFKLTIEFDVPILIKLNHFITDDAFMKSFKSYFGEFVLKNYPQIMNKKKIIFVYSNVFKLN
jgi:hypothetical protein